MTELNNTAREAQQIANALIPLKFSASRAGLSDLAYFISLGIAETQIITAEARYAQADRLKRKLGSLRRTR